MCHKRAPSSVRLWRAVSSHCPFIECQTSVMTFTSDMNEVTPFYTATEKKLHVEPAMKFYFLCTFYDSIYLFSYVYVK